MNSFCKIVTFISATLPVFLLSANVQAQGTKIDSASNIIQKVEVEASFPGGEKAWARYISDAITDNIKKLRKSDYGTCIIRFIVDTKGRVSDVHALTMEKSRLAKIAVQAIENGPRWHPAQQNGKFVNAYRLQPVTIAPPDK